MIVADTNLLVYLLFDGEHTNAAERVLEADAEWAVPLLWRSEFRNVMALYLRRGTLTHAAAVEIYQQAARLVIGREYEVDTARVLALVQKSACSAYDCECVALAGDLHVPLITSDAKVLREFPDAASSPAAFAPPR